MSLRTEHGSHADSSRKHQRTHPGQGDRRTARGSAGESHRFCTRSRDGRRRQLHPQTYSCRNLHHRSHLHRIYHPASHRRASRRQRPDTGLADGHRHTRTRRSHRGRTEEPRIGTRPDDGTPESIVRHRKHGREGNEPQGRGQRAGRTDQDYGNLRGRRRTTHRPRSG